MIIGGAETPRGPMMKRTKVSITREKRTRGYVPEGSISFSDEDAEGIMQPHNDALGLLDKIVLAIQVLNGLNMACKATKRAITLPVNTARMVQHMKFYVIEGEMWYNALLVRSWVHDMRAVPSTLHQMLKFPIPEEVKTVHGEQPAAREIFAVEETAHIPKAPLLNDVDKSVK
ncbi:uncharacterized protein LOC132054284 [Lycium ferocissimum]|uniref:uncharacterized protein LOC132054284 n=1 Tax=Lycium ferocissimum TaxID=112874 RepID=UPI0028151D67|nr:uncharacterized protein LOC132054284 [Lycium ferocissimum]